MNQHSFHGRWFPSSVRYLVAVVLLSSLLFACLRLCFLLFGNDGLFSFQDRLFWDCFVVGWRFDMVVVSYVLAIPVLLIFLKNGWLLNQYFLLHISGWIVSMGMCVAVFACVADMPYYRFFKNRLTVDALQWMNAPGTVISMVWSNQQHLLFLIMGILLSILVFLIFHRLASIFLLKNQQRGDVNQQSRKASIVFFLLCGSICFLGMRGKVTHPIRPGDAFYCTNPLLNQGALNPVFTFMKSLSNKVRLMEDEEAISKTMKHLGLEFSTDGKRRSPFYRMVKGDTVLSSKPNVVLILMEGMAARFMGQFGNTKGLTPVLDSLAEKSLFFENAFSAGIHTNNGVFSSLYGFPALKRVRPMSAVPVRNFTGLPYALKTRGYRNYFFCSHNREFDNLGNFIPNNHFDALYTQEDFPAGESIGPYGVPDGYLFKRLLNHLDTATVSSPVFATVLTASNHDPYVIPGDFQSNHSDKELRAIQYADDAIGEFISKAALKPWFSNTLFVFVADHGRVYGMEPYDLQYSFSHIPILIFGSGLQSANRHKGFICQMDLFPTIMGLLGGTYLNNTAGVDVLKHARPAAYFSQDDKIGCVNDRWLYVYRFGGKESLYEYKTGSVVDFADREPAVREFLREYALSQTQTSEYVISLDLTGPE